MQSNPQHFFSESYFLIYYPCGYTMPGAYALGSEALEVLHPFEVPTRDSTLMRRMGDVYPVPHGLRRGGLVAAQWVGNAP